MCSYTSTSFSRLLLLFALVTTLVAASDFSALDQKAGGAGTGGGTGGGAGTSNGTSSAAKQFHLSFIGASKTNAKLLHYTLDWVTPATTTTSQLVYGTSADALTTRVNGKSSGTVDEDAGKTVMCWSALVQNVAVGSTIYYALADDTSSKPKSFTAQPADGFTWAVFGDLGAPAQKGASGVALPALKNALDVTKAYHGVLNIGDLAYELVGSNGKNYMDELESITSKVPMQVTVGNHEYQYGMSPDFALQNYYRRFSGLTLGVGTMSGSYSNEFYSFDSGLVHFVFINTEVYGDEAFATLQADGKTWKADEAARAAMAATQVDWLAYDLSRVKRSETPYVIVCGHRPPFKTPGPLSLPGNKFAKEIIPLMSKYQVDLYLAGHEHTYLMFEASTFKDFNVPPIIISGSPGNNEFIRTEAELNIKGFTWKTHIPKYGFGYLTATKESLKWQWGSAATDASHKPSPAMWTMEDELTIPRRTSFATVTPEGKPVKTPGDLSTVWTSTKNETGGSGGRDGAGDAGNPSGKSNSSKPGSATTAPQNSATSTQASVLVGAAATLVALLSIQLV